MAVGSIQQLFPANLPTISQLNSCALCALLYEREREKIDVRLTLLCSRTVVHTFTHKGMKMHYSVCNSVSHISAARKQGAVCVAVHFSSVCDYTHSQ